jgi:hypothetical protein
MTENIEINGINYPIIINFYVIGEFQKETGLSFDVLVDLENKLYLVEPLLWHALRIGHIVEKKEFKLTRDDMAIVMSDNDVYTKFIAVITKFFPQDAKESKEKKRKT